MNSFLGRGFLWPLIALLSSLGPAMLPAAEARLEIHWIDVEGGAATLILTPARESILIDTGLPRRSQVTRIHDHLRQVAELDYLDFLVVTHYDLDHHGGAAELATMIPIRRVYDNGRFEKMVNDPGPEYFAFPAGNRVVIQPGADLPLAQAANRPRVRLRCLAARQEFVDPPPDAPLNRNICRRLRSKDPDLTENANSIVLLLEYGPFRFFNAADLTWNLEANLVCPVNLVGKVDVYQVTHHGLDRSNNSAVIESLQPTVSVMNNGKTKGCQPETFLALQAAPSVQAMYQLHKNLRPDGKVYNTQDELIANREPDQVGNPIRLVTDPSGERYTLSIEASGHAQTFVSKRAARAE